MLPYGTLDLDAEALVDPGPPKRVRCYVRGCNQLLQVPSRHFRGDVCPSHGIRCHHSSAGPTYVYQDVRRNIIVAPNLFARQVVGHPFKYESHRLGAERSEDALTWNVFRSLYETGRLSTFAEQITGIQCRVEPFLYLWGLEITADSFRPWQLLIEARRRFESNLPVERPLTEPDIALHLPGKYLILIEAKFMSPNTSYTRGPRRDSRSLSFEELLTIYSDPKLKILDQRKATAAPRVFHQLWRNTVFAEWMSQADHPRTKAFHVNLVREGVEVRNQQEFTALLHPEFKSRFRRWTWEQIISSGDGEPALIRMVQYMRMKTAGLIQAFSVY